MGVVERAPSGDSPPAQTDTSGRPMSSRRRKIMDYVSAELLVDPEMGLDEHEEILETGRIDSMSVMRLVFFIKDEFSITIPNQDLVAENFKSIDALETYLGSYDHG